MTDRGDQARPDNAALDLTRDSDDAAVDADVEGRRIEREVPHDDLPDHFVQDLAVRPVENAHTSTRLIIPTSRPASSTTGGRFTQRGLLHLHRGIQYVRDGPAG